MDNNGRVRNYGATRFRWITVGLLVMLILSVNTFLAFRSITELTEKHKSVINTGNVIVALKNLHVAILSVESGQRGYLLTENKEYLKYYYESLSTLDVQIATVKSLRADLPNQNDKFLELLELVRGKVDELTTTVNLALNKNERQAANIVLSGKGFELYDQIHETIETIEGNEFALQAQLYERTLAAQEAAKLQFVVFSLISVVLLCGMFLLLRMNSVREGKYLASLELHNAQLEETIEDRTRDLRVYSEELARSNRELEDFAFVASHDLQEPLRKIQAFSSRIQSSYQSSLDEKGLDYLNRMTNAATRMSSLIGDLLEFSRIKTRGKPFVEVDLNDTFSDIIDDLEVAIAESGAQIKVDPLPIIEADASQMSQLFLNLLSNAVKFRSASETPQILVTHSLETHSITPVSESKEWHVFHVIDNGIGFSQEYASKIFMPFQRLHGRDEYKGTGIGLAVCRRIVERHGGSIYAQSELNSGTDFTVLLPVEAVNPIEAIDGPDADDNLAAVNAGHNTSSYGVENATSANA